jgi:hypothetical protein
MIKKYPKTFSLLFSVFLVFAFSTSILNAQSVGPTPGSTGSAGSQNGSGKVIKIQNPFKAETIPQLINIIITDIILPIGVALSVCMVMYSGFKYVMSRGNPGEVSKAYESLKNALIGAALLLGAKIIAEVIQNTINQFR